MSFTSSLPVKVGGSQTGEAAKRSKSNMKNNHANSYPSIQGKMLYNVYMYISNF